MNLQDINFKAKEVALNGNNKLALGLSDIGALVVASTPTGEGYTAYDNLIVAGHAFDSIVERANLTIINSITK